MPLDPSQPAEAATSTDAGCGCRVGGGRFHLPLVLLLLAAVLLRKRR